MDVRQVLLGRPIFLLTVLLLREVGRAIVVVDGEHDVAVAREVAARATLGGSASAQSVEHNDWYEF